DDEDAPRRACRPLHGGGIGHRAPCGWRRCALVSLDLSQPARHHARADGPAAIAGRLHRREPVRLPRRSAQGCARRGDSRQDGRDPVAARRRPRSSPGRRVGMRQYLDILRKAVEEGDQRTDRTGVGTRAIFGEVMRFDLSAGFPAVTTKRLAFRSVIAELLWFLAGSSDVNELNALGVHIWDGNAFAEYW